MPITFLLFMAGAFDAYRMEYNAHQEIASKLSAMENSVEGMLASEMVHFNVASDPQSIEINIKNASALAPIKIEKIQTSLKINGDQVSSMSDWKGDGINAIIVPSGNQWVVLPKFDKSKWNSGGQIETAEIILKTTYERLNFKARYEACFAWQCSFKLEELTTVSNRLCTRTACNVSGQEP